MNYYLKERDALETYQKNAGSKARKDVEEILDSLDWKPVQVAVPFKRNKKLSAAVLSHFRNFFFYYSKLHRLHRNDTLLVQFPPRSHSIFFPFIYRFLRLKGVKVIILIHDIEQLRFIHLEVTSSKSQVRIKLEEMPLLKSADAIICHNEVMRQYLLDQGVPEKKLITLGIFDYLTPCEPKTALSTPDQSDKPEVILAGNLNPGKSIYLKELHQVPEVLFRLYGVGYEDLGQENVEYMGSFMPEELPGALKGHFGLVWDGTSIESCEGPFGNYLRYNNPHKLSLYLVSGLPVIVWEESAMAGFIKDNHLGITIGSLKDIPEAIYNLSPKEYEEMALNARAYSARLKDGYYLKNALLER